MINNTEKPVIELHHSRLLPVDGNSYKRECPVCNDGILAMNRDKGGLKDTDRCLGCGQRVKYLDVKDGVYAIYHGRDEIPEMHIGHVSKWLNKNLEKLIIRGNDDNSMKEVEAVIFGVQDEFLLFRCNTVKK